MRSDYGRLFPEVTLAALAPLVATLKKSRSWLAARLSFGVQADSNMSLLPEEFASSIDVPLVAPAAPESVGRSLSRFRCGGHDGPRQCKHRSTATPESIAAGI